MVAKSWILHTISIVADVIGAFARILVLGGLTIQRLQQRFQAAFIEFVITPLNPFPALLAVAIDDFPHRAQVLFGMKTVEDLNGLGKQFFRRIPDPRRTIAQHDAAGGLSEGPARSFAQYPLGELDTPPAGPRGNGGEIPRGPLGPSRFELDKPVIAAIEGSAVAGGMELGLWCDFRVMAEGSYFGVYCRRWGVPLIDGGTVRLPRIGSCLLFWAA